MNIVLLAGSPSAPSRVATLVDHLAAQLRGRHARTEIFDLDGFDPASLVYAQFDAPEIQRYQAAVAEADALVVATPVYQSSFSGAVKLLLDLIPQNGLRHKIALPVASGGSPAHLLTLDYALKPVLAALGADSVLGGVYASGSDLKREADTYAIQDSIRDRLNEAADELADRLQPAVPNRTALESGARSGRPAAQPETASRPRLFADDGMTVARKKAYG